MTDFKSLAGPFFLDGATGTQLQRRGMPPGCCGEQWILDHPEALLDVQRRYAAAGSQAVYAPTFGANRASLGKYGLGDQVREYNLRLTELSRRAVGGGVLVGGDLSPCGLSLPPMGETGFDELVDVFMQQAAALEEAGVDFFGVETQLSLGEARAAVLAIKSVSKKQILVSFTCAPNGRTLYGGDLCGILLALGELGIDGFGLNCVDDLSLLRRLLTELRPLTALPLIAKPNGGRPAYRDGAACYDTAPEALADAAVGFYAAGACLLGGCCGTDERHIAAMRAALEGAAPVVRGTAPRELYASEYRTVELRRPGEAETPTVIRGVPVDDDFEESACDAALEGAELLRVELRSMAEARLVLESQSAVKTPLLVCCADGEIEKAFSREYNGRAKYEKLREE